MGRFDPFPIKPRSSKPSEWRLGAMHGRKELQNVPLQAWGGGGVQTSSRRALKRYERHLCQWGIIGPLNYRGEARQTARMAIGGLAQPDQAAQTPFAASGEGGRECWLKVDSPGSQNLPLRR